jgi:NAD(P)-dependent dehydrogenase (short-subunit alcohol dehydrogenase family)
MKLTELARVLPFGNKPAPLHLQGRVALITGGAGGIGLATAEALAAGGARVVIVDVDQNAVDKAVAGIGQPLALGVRADVRDRDAMAAAVDKAVERFGRLDIVVANAGVTPIPATIRTLNVDDFDRVLAINLTGVVNTVVPAMEQVIAHSGHIVVIASVAAFAPGFAGVAYMASKAAVEQFGRALRIELGMTTATAGVAYFGVVNTAMVANTLDSDPLGQEMDLMMPYPLRRRITATHAAQVIVGGITSRAARTIAPKVWGSYSLMREVINRRMDDMLRVDPHLHSMLHKLEERNRTQ